MVEHIEIPEKVQCVFTGRPRLRDGKYEIEIPDTEVIDGSIESGEVYRVVVLPAEDGGRDDRRATAGRGRDRSGAPVEEGERRTVTIVAIGEQGDGIAHVERGYVVIVPETERGETVRIEITHVRETVAFSEVIERTSQRRQ